MQTDAQEQNFQKRNIEVQKLPDYYLDDERLEELKLFCQSLDPYKNLSLEERFRLQEFGVKEFNDPFAITNQLLLILENNLQFREKND